MKDLLLTVERGSLDLLRNGYTDTIEKMLRRLDMDLEYLEHRSIWADIKIMLLTVKRMIIGE